METHYEVKDKRNKSMSTRKFNLDEEHTKMMKSLHIEDYKLSRIPRPDDPEADKLKQRKTASNSGSGSDSSSSSNSASPGEAPAVKKGWLW
jgi:hypothetical protein